MSLADRLLRRAPAILRDRARTVAPRAGVIAIGLHRAVEREFPATHAVPFDHWRRVVTVAGVAVASVSMRDVQLQEFEFTDLNLQLLHGLWEAHPKSDVLLAECSQSMVRGMEALGAANQPAGGRLDSFDLAVGGWMVTRLFGHFPPDAWAPPLASYLGAAVRMQMHGCWDT